MGIIQRYNMITTENVFKSLTIMCFIFHQKIIVQEKSTLNVMTTTIQNYVCLSTMGPQFSLTLVLLTEHT